MTDECTLAFSESHREVEVSLLLQGHDIDYLYTRAKSLNTMKK